MKITTAKKPRMENKKKKEAMKLYKKDFDYLQDQYENDNRGIVILNCGNIVNSLKKALFDIETRNGNPHDFQEVFFLKTRALFQRWPGLVEDAHTSILSVPCRENPS